MSEVERRLGTIEGTAHMTGNTVHTLQQKVKVLENARLSYLDFTAEVQKKLRQFK